MLLEIVKDFVRSARTFNGCGYFEYNKLAISLARGLSKQQLRKFHRYGIVPSAFFIWLREARIVLPTMNIPQGGATYDELIKTLRNFYVGDEQMKSTREHEERQRIRKYCAPELNKAFALQDHIWAHGRAYKHLRAFH